MGRVWLVVILLLGAVLGGAQTSGAAAAIGSQAGGRGIVMRLSLPSARYPRNSLALTTLTIRNRGSDRVLITGCNPPSPSVFSATSDGLYNGIVLTGFGLYSFPTCLYPRRPIFVRAHSSMTRHIPVWLQYPYVFATASETCRAPGIIHIGVGAGRMPSCKYPRTLRTPLLRVHLFKGLPLRIRVHRGAPAFATVVSPAPAGERLYMLGWTVCRTLGGPRVNYMSVYLNEWTSVQGKRIAPRCESGHGVIGWHAVIGYPGRPVAHINWGRWK